MQLARQRHDLAPDPVGVAAVEGVGQAGVRYPDPVVAAGPTTMPQLEVTYRPLPQRDRGVICKELPPPDEPVLGPLSCARHNLGVR